MRVRVRVRAVGWPAELPSLPTQVYRSHMPTNTSMCPLLLLPGCSCSCNNWSAHSLDTSRSRLGNFVAWARGNRSRLVGSGLRAACETFTFTFQLVSPATSKSLTDVRVDYRHLSVSQLLTSCDLRFSATARAAVRWLNVLNCSPRPILFAREKA